MLGTSPRIAVAQCIPLHRTQKPLDQKIHGVLVITKETEKKQQTLRTFMHHENVNSAGWLQVYLSAEQPMVLKAEQGPEDPTY